MEDVRNCVEKYARIFILSVHNMRNNKLKDLRLQWKDSRFFFGKNKVIALALGKSPENEVANGLHKLSLALRGQCGLLFTNRSKKEVCFSFVKIQIHKKNLHLFIYILLRYYNGWRRTRK